MNSKHAVSSLILVLLSFDAWIIAIQCSVSVSIQLLQLVLYCSPVLNKVMLYVPSTVLWLNNVKFMHFILCTVRVLK